jgi:hypothetical protein
VSLLRHDIWRPTSRISPRSHPSVGALRCRKKFLKYFPRGFRDDKYITWERGYKSAAHLQWEESLNQLEFCRLLAEKEFSEVAARAVRIESRTNLLFSFEKMALRDAIRSPEAARSFALGLYYLLHGQDSPDRRFETWCSTLGKLPRKQTRVLTWPLVTVFGFIAQPTQHIFLKPRVTQLAAAEYEFDFQYASTPSLEVYENLRSFAETIRRDVADLKPRDYIDLQSFIWVQGSDEYAD